MPAIAITAENLGKRYRLGRRERYRALRDELMDSLRAPFRRAAALVRGDAAREEPEEIWALRGASFEIAHGEAVGLIGRNGAGKSTLLKILSRITEPTEGTAEVRGRVGSLLEVGTGFHPELTGRENVFLNGAILGMRRREIVRKFDDIVAFAEVEKFIDTPVKQYSSGMYMRLAFAVAAHLEPEILLVDEVLAVGDAAFQRRCLGKMDEIARAGRTVVFVSHNMGAVRSLCRRAILLEGGRVAADGPSADVVARYLESVAGTFVLGAGPDAGPLEIQAVTVRGPDGEPTTQIAPGDRLTVEIRYRARERIEQPYFFVSIRSAWGPVFQASMLFDGRRPRALEGEGSLSCTFESLPLLTQLYTVHVGARAADGMSPLWRAREVAFFHVSGRLADHGLPGELADALAEESVSAIVPYEWRFPDGTSARVAIEPREARGAAR